MEIFAFFAAALPLLLLSKSTIGRPHVQHRVLTAENQYDLGVLNTCATPRLSACSKYVDYQVPGVLADQRIVTIKEATIMAIYNVTKAELQSGYNSTKCAEALLELECHNQFPRCVDDSEGVHKVSFSDRSCQKLMAQCAPSLASRFATEGYCSLNTTVPLEQCKRTSDYSGYQFCNTVTGWSDWYITDWMHLYLQKIEQQIAAFKMSVYGESRYSRCVQRYIEFQCQSVGRCWDQGRRAELIPSHSDCDNVVNWYACCVYIEYRRKYV